MKTSMTVTETIRSSDFWFHDGSIILKVDNTLFRVHQTILANHSDIFSDLFKLPQPISQETVDGCTLVQLHDVVEEVVELLGAIYHPSYFNELAPDAELGVVVTFLSGILRLSTKYAILSLRSKCISILVSKFPTTFDGYIIKASLPHHERYKSESLFRTINLAQETNVPQVLPYAYYCVARLSSRRLLKQPPIDISWKQKTICLVGRERLRWAEKSLSHAFLILFIRAPTCVSPLCEHARGPHTEWHIIESARSPHPLREYTTWNALNVCVECMRYAKAQHQMGRAEVWERLPGMFELPSWGELAAMQDR